MNNLELERVKQLIARLSPADKTVLRDWLDELMKAEPVQPKPRRSMLGLLADLGPAPSDEDIEEARREMWKNFPRDDY